MTRCAPALAIAFAVGCGGGVVASSPASSPPQGPVPSLPATIAVQATAALVDLGNTRIGTVSFADTPAGLLVIGSVSGLGIGVHGLHLHTVGACDPPFASAGGHFNPTGVKHGFRNPAGHHAGDMPNIVTPPSGTHGFQFIVDGVKLTGKAGLLDADGAAIVIHSSADDYLADPSGNSGGRMACGVITLVK